jgi:hypothetical protein
MPATVGPTVLATAGMAMWGLLADLELVEHGDELMVKDILAGEHPTPDPSQITKVELHVICDSLI